MRRFWIGIVAALVLIATATSADAQSQPSVSVEPASNLADGQSIRIVASPGDLERFESFFLFPESSGIVVAQCLAEAVRFTGPDTVLLDICGNFSFPEVIAPGGRATSEYTVRTSFLNYYETRTIECGRVPNDCLVSVLVTLGSSLSESHLLHAPVTFAKRTPLTSTDCKRGGWRDLADDQGLLFRNEGQCVKYVVARPR